MAEYLDTQETSAGISRIIKDAKKDLIIISPYLKVNQMMRDLIKGKSKIANLLSIKIIYGKTELQDSEKKWINEIEDLKLLYTKNLHAKCYFNENEAIITSMNLYEFSQQNNTEMGVLITKKDDSKAYEKLNADIEMLLGTSDRIRNIDEIKNIKSETKNENKHYNKELSFEQKKTIAILKEWRYLKSKEIYKPAYSILKDNEIIEISKNQIRTKEDLRRVKGIADIKINKFGREIMEMLGSVKKFTIVKIINTQIQYDKYEGYDRIQIENIDTKERKWLDTTQELPKKNKIVAVKINKTWFNEYIYLE